MRIRITNGSGWYSNKVGDDFDVFKRCRNYNGYFVKVWNEACREWDCNTHWVMDGDYEIISEEPTPQLAGIHELLGNIALEVAELKRNFETQTKDLVEICDLFHDRLTNLESESLSPLQLAILNAKDTPADVKLTLIVEAGRLESERQAKLDA